jgi:hypothetical protein
MIKLNTKVIKYGMKEEDANVEGLVPSRKHIPEWYKKLPSFLGSNGPMIRPEVVNKTAKLCVPYLDSISSGYIIELWQDIEVVRKHGTLQIFWAADPKVLDQRDAAPASTFPIPEGHDATHFTWQIPVAIQTPIGYSCFVTHPINRFDLPFTTLSAIVDTDVNPMGKGSIPFFLKKDFEGIIPRGTPLLQVIPFKRDNWTAKEDNALYKASERMSLLSRSVAYGFYKKTGWSRKNYD